MREMSYLNIYWFMQTLLDRKDRMSMHSGLEVRVPFCDHRIAEYLYNVPWSLKDLGGYEKGLLRRAFDGYLPDKILWRKKSPYPKTHNPNYMAAVCSLLEPVLNDKNEPIHQLIDLGRTQELLTANDPTPWYSQLMTTPQTVAYFYMLNFWLKKYNVEIEI
jgi:asparagine synthase (glutamine-hydrolysing)